MSVWTIRGTPAYMAPEVRHFQNFKLESDSEVDYLKADVFSLGLVLFYMIS